MPRDFSQCLREAGLIGPADALSLTPLGGGVSSDIYLARTAQQEFVVKAALPRLRVQDEWIADVSRNAVERAWFEYAGAIVPGAVPRVLAGGDGGEWFAMEYLGGGFATWKERLLAGVADQVHARRAGDILGRVHRASWDDAGARARFATVANFHALRTEPYFLTTARRVPGAAADLLAEAARLERTELALVHGDYSPKNLLVTADRMVVLDAEVAWFGDPAFDTAFLLTHLHLKALLHAAAPDPILALAREFWIAYGAALGGLDPDGERRTARLLLCLLLARAHGKSPAEYLTAAQRAVVTDFVLAWLPRRPDQLGPVTAAWRQALSN